MIGRRTVIAVTATFAATVALEDAHADAAKDAQAVINSANRVVRRMRASKQGAKVTALLRAAKGGVLVVPDIIRAGLLVGGETGNGVLLAKDAKGAWSNPCYVRSSSASYGFQAGVKRYHLLMIVINEKAIRQMAEFGAQFGTHMSLAAGDTGYDGSLINTTDALADAYSFTETDTGLFGGGSLEGTALTPRQDLNEGIFGKGVTAPQILFSGKFPPRKGSATLREGLTVKA